MKILIINDDGFRGKGLHALVRALKKDHDVTVVVPDSEQSGKSHSMTFLDPLYLDKFYSVEADHDIYTVRGTPGDCVLMGLDQVLAKQPDLLLSGINKGFNAASSIVYSGTVSAAYEGACRGIPSIALSAGYVDADFDLDARIFADLLPELMKREKGNAFFYNINFPSVSLEELKGIRKTCIAEENIVECLEKRTDPFSRDYYWHAYDCQDEESVCTTPGSDMEALHEGYISITPLKLDYFDKNKFETMSDLNDVFAAIKARK